MSRPRLADRLRGLSVRVGLDADTDAIIALDVHDRNDEAKTLIAMRTRSDRLSQGFRRDDSSRDGDRDRVRQVYAAQFVARRI